MKSTSIYEKRVKAVIYGELPEGVVLWLEKRFGAVTMPELLEEARQKLEERIRRELDDIMSFQDGE